MTYLILSLESKTLSAKFEKILSSFEENQKKKIEELVEKHQSDITNADENAKNLIQKKIRKRLMKSWIKFHPELKK